MAKTTQHVDPDMEKRIIRLARRTWDGIAPDALAGGSMRRAEVVELVSDADRMADGGDKEAYEFWKALPHAQADAIVARAFPSARYS